MTDRIRFHCDENVDSAVADGLRRRGVDVTMPSDVGLIGASDEDRLAFAIAQSRVVVTHDDDFLAMAQRGTSLRTGLLPHAVAIHRRNSERIAIDRGLPQS